MRMARSSDAAGKTVVMAHIADPAFEQSLRATFGASGAIELRVVPGAIDSVERLDSEGVTVVIVDLDTGGGGAMATLGHLAATGVRPRFLSELAARGIKIAGGTFDPSKPL
jgi:hypothetical protein